MENEKMFERKRNSIIKVTIILIIIISVNLLINYPVVNAGRWRYQYTVEDVYNITQSSDDAVAVIGNYYESNGEYITLKSNIFSSIIGFRFDNIDIVHNSTHSFIVQNAYLSLYSDQYPYDPLSEKVTIYFESENDNIQTFSNYTELVSRNPSYNYKNWDLDDVHGSHSGGEWCNSPNMQYLIGSALSFDNDTICLLMYSERGVWFRNFATYDLHSDYAPRLHIIYDMYEYEEDPPTGYSDAIYIEQYEGFEIWYIDTSSWLNFSKFEQIGSDVYSGENDTFFKVTNMYQDTASYKYRSVIEKDIHNIKFGVNITGLPYSIASGYVTLWSITNEHGSNFKIDEGYIFTIRTDSDRCYGYAWSVEGDALKDSAIWFHTIMETELPREYYFNLTFNENTMTFTNQVYDDIDMLTLNATYTDTFSSGAGDINSIYEYVNSRTEPEGSSTGWTGDHISKLPLEGFIIVDEDDVVIDFIDVETIEDVEVWIDNYIGASSEYDKTPWMGDFTLLLVGLVGVAFIPLGFLIFVSSVRDGDIIGGLQTLVLMFFIGIGCIITWLWA